MGGVLRWSRISPTSFIRQVRVRCPDEGAAAAAMSHHAAYIQAHYDFHHHFWHRNNHRFATEKEAFMRDHQLAEGADAEDLAIFYRQFMLKHRADFAHYHYESYRRAFTLLAAEARLLWHQTGRRIVRLWTKPAPLLASQGRL